MRSIVLAALLLTAPAVFAQAGSSTPRSLDECFESLGSEVIGIEAIEAACPGAEQALRDLEIAPFVPAWQWTTLGADGIRNLQAIEQRYHDVPEGNALDVDNVRAVLGSLQKPTSVQVSESWFDRVKHWLRDAFDQGPNESQPWLNRWLQKHPLSETARLVFLYGILITILVLAVVVIVNEVRVARQGRGKQHDKRTNKTSDAAGAAIDPDVLDLDAVARTDRPSVILRVLVATLVKTGRLPAARSFTHRELATRARFDDSSQRDNFERVAQLAERVVYGGDAGSDDLDEIVQTGQALDKQLATHPAGAAS